MGKVYQIKLYDGSFGRLRKDENKTYFTSQDYKFFFDVKSGFFARWGETQQDDGNLELGLPEIADIEISTICNGVGGTPCAFCYKSNNNDGTYMSLDTFKKVFQKLPPTITQIAFGIGDINANPDMWEIFNYCRDNGVVPNVTVNGEGISDYIADKLVEKCGAVAVSVYNKEKSYNAIKKLTDRGLKQVNIHFMVSKQTLERAFTVLRDSLKDNRLSKLNAIVFLSLKKKGNATQVYESIDVNDFRKLSNFALKRNIPIGFDSCSAISFLNTIKDTKYENKLKTFIEPCESTIYSSYINVNAEFFPCSFIENTDGWENGINVIDSDDFLQDVWYNKRTKDFRKRVINCRNCGVACPIYEI